jgi:predicted  nucleic acid-binding Zn-ribbon protein
MSPVARKSPGSKASAGPQRRDDVEALIALVSLDADVAERKAAASGSAGPREGRADPAARRTMIASRIPRATLEDYENARRQGLLPAAVATRGRVCWGCFHGLSGAITAPFQDAQAFVCCPHCERVLFNPDWIERR